MAVPSKNTIKASFVNYMPEEFFRTYWAERDYPVDGSSYALNGLSKFQDDYLDELARACNEAWERFNTGLLIPFLSASGGNQSGPLSPHSGGQDVSVARGGLLVTIPFNLTFSRFDFDNLTLFPNDGSYTIYLKHYNQVINNGIFKETLDWIKSWSWTGTINGQPDAGFSGWIQPGSGPPIPGPWTRGKVDSNSSTHTLGSGQRTDFDGTQMYNTIISNYLNTNLLKIKYDNQTDTFLAKHLKAICDGFVEAYFNWIPNAEWFTPTTGIGTCQARTGKVQGGKIMLGRMR